MSTQESSLTSEPCAAAPCALKDDCAPVPALRFEAEDASPTLAQLAQLLASEHSKTIRNLYCDGEPIGRMLIEALERSQASPREAAEQPNADRGGELIELTDHLAKWGPPMYEASKRYRVCVQCGGFEAMLGMKYRLYRAQQSLLKRIEQDALVAPAHERLLNLARDADGGASLTHLQDTAAAILTDLAGGPGATRACSSEASSVVSAERLMSYQAIGKEQAPTPEGKSLAKGFLHAHIEEELEQQRQARQQELLELERYRWVRQPSNLNCMMWEFKGNTPEQADAYIDKQTQKLAKGAG